MSVKRQAPAATRNAGPIGAVLAEELPDAGLVLEVASGTGEHALAYARQFPHLIWQPSDPDPEARASIAAWRAEEGPTNLREPLVLDASAPDWPVAHADALLCINMIHISPWEAAEGLFAGAARILVQGAPLMLYGPYFEGGVAAAPSNVAFDESLKGRNPAWGIRDLAAVDRLAASYGFSRLRRVAMPANNLMVIYRKR